MNKSDKTIDWNRDMRLIVSDVDETIADLYVEAEPEMILELTRLLKEGKAIFFVTGQGLKSVQWRIIDKIPQQLRSHILIGHCSGAEVWGYNPDGTPKSQPFYSVYNLSEEQKKKWRELVQQLVKEFNLKIYPAMPVPEFLKQVGGNPSAIMLEDRGPQITFEVINGYDLTPEQANKLEISIPETHGNYDLRVPILERAEQLFVDANLQVSSRLGGVFAIDFAIKGVSKTTAIKYVLSDDSALSSLGLNRADLRNAKQIEVWGDKFSTIRGGTDRHMSEALPKDVRSIDFREENPDEFEKGYNIVVWSGKYHLHHGLLEYLKSR